MKYYSRVVQNDVGELSVDLEAVLPRFWGKTVLVTGASGFLMSYIVETLLASNVETSSRLCRVIAVDNLQTGLPERLAHLEATGSLRFLKHDVSVPIELDEPVHWIVHGASIASPVIYRKYPLETISANVTGTQNLLETARKHAVQGMIIMSTSEIYGDPTPDSIPTTEDYRGNVSCTGPRACYDESKRMAETLCMTYFRLYGTPIKIIRPFNVYGPGMRLNDQRVLPDFISCVLDRKPIKLLSSGRPTRSFCYVSDATALMLRALSDDFKGEALNVGNDEIEISMIDLANLIARVGAAILNQPRIDVVQCASDDKDYLVDNPQRRCPSLKKAKHLFPDWLPKVSLEEGANRFFRHFVDKQTPDSDRISKQNSPVA